MSLNKRELARIATLMGTHYDPNYYTEPTIRFNATDPRVVTDRHRALPHWPTRDSESSERSE